MQNTIEIRSRYTVSVLETTTERNGFSFGGCDIYDLVAATTCGAIGGLIDIFMVGAPGEGKPLEKWADNQVDEAVKKFAKLTGWSPRKGKEDSLSSAIGYLEKTFTVNYDQRHSGDINNRFKMSTKNHHFKSLSHSPDPVGLFFSLLDQFCSTSTFVSNGTIIPITTEKNELGSLKLCGHTFESKLFCGFANWLGHVMSDIAGSSGTRGQGGRGAGLAAPFYELFQFCNFGKLNVGKDKQTFADVATRVYQQGYDTRFALAMAAPVLVVDLMVKLIWALRQYFTQGIKPTERWPSNHAPCRQWHDVHPGWRGCVRKVCWRNKCSGAFFKNQLPCLDKTVDASDPRAQHPPQPRERHRGNGSAKPGLQRLPRRPRGSSIQEGIRGI